ncbi:MAG: hypothetical protein AAF726_25355 [Planctomycetota bacterium]
MNSATFLAIAVTVGSTCPLASGQSIIRSVEFSSESSDTWTLPAPVDLPAPFNALDVVTDGALAWTPAPPMPSPFEQRVQVARYSRSVELALHGDVTITNTAQSPTDFNAEVLYDTGGGFFTNLDINDAPTGKWFGPTDVTLQAGEQFSVTDTPLVAVGPITETWLPPFSDTSEFAQIYLSVLDPDRLLFDATIDSQTEFESYRVDSAELRSTASLTIEVDYELELAPTFDVCNSPPNSTGVPAKLDAYGSTRFFSEWLTIRAEDLPDGAAAILFVGTAGAPAGPNGLCVGGQVSRRGGIQIAENGIADFAIDLVGIPLGGAVLQVLHRDPVLGTAASNAIGFSIIQ